MKHKKIKTALIALSCLFLVGGGLTACNPEDPTPIVTISNGETATLEVGETLQLLKAKQLSLLKPVISLIPLRLRLPKPSFLLNQMFKSSQLPSTRQKSH